jgi:hypothetical protein
VSKPRYGWRYASALPDGTAEEFLVLTEDPWNDVMRDSVVVPVFRDDEPKQSNVRVLVADDLVAICTRPSNLAHEFLGEPIARCDSVALKRVTIGIWLHLDIHRRINKTTSPPPAGVRSDWWPRQGEFHFGPHPTGGKDKLYASVASNLWTSLPKVTYTAAVRLTSRTKSFRARWEVPIAGSFVVSGDLYLIPYEDFEQAAPPPKYPQGMTQDELAALAASQRRALSITL